MSAHTPGPWTVGYLRIEGRADIYADSEPTSIASVRTGANAALVAAAPELLEALYVARDQIREFLPNVLGEALTTIEAAIAKAEGRG